MKQLKDYIHLYLGCDVIYYDKEGNHAGFGKNTHGLHVNIQMCVTSVCSVKPILRPLSDMTEEEGEEIFGDEWDSDSPNARDIIMNMDGNENELRLTPMETKSLLDKSFDLFGLIDLGLAINMGSNDDEDLIIERKKCLSFGGKYPCDGNGCEEAVKAGYCICWDDMINSEHPESN